MPSINSPDISLKSRLGIFKLIWKEKWALTLIFHLKVGRSNGAMLLQYVVNIHCHWPQGFYQERDISKTIYTFWINIEITRNCATTGHLKTPNTIHWCHIFFQQTIEYYNKIIKLFNMQKKMCIVLCGIKCK